MKNADAVRELFASNFGKDGNGKDRKWPQWSSVAGEMGVPGRIRGHWDKGWHSSTPARSKLATADTETARSKLAATPASERVASRSADHRPTPRKKVPTVRSVSALTPPNPLDLLDVVRWR